MHSLFIRVVPLGALVAAATVAAADFMAPSFMPPADMPVDSAPIFICYGFDDNVYLDGVQWVDQLFQDRKNPDGNPARATFYVSTHPDIENPDLWTAVHTLLDHGHEVGNHTQHHDAELFNANLGSADLWNTEIGGCTSDLATQSQIPAEEIVGFRTPFLQYSDATFQAMQAHGILYDCSIEHYLAQFQAPDGSWGCGEVWPYTLDNGKAASSYGSLGAKVPGLWELPVHEFMPATGWQGVTGLDYNVWFAKGMSGATAVDLWKSSLKIRVEGDPARSCLPNRAPLFMGMHSDEYTDDNEANASSSAKTPERRAAVAEFLDWALAYNPAVRVVPMVEVIKWMKNPVPYTQYHYVPSGSTALKDCGKHAGAAEALSIRSAQGSLFVTTPVAGLVTVSLYDMRGRMVADLGQRNFSAGENALSLSQPLAAGAYLLNLRGAITSSKSLIVK